MIEEVIKQIIKARPPLFGDNLVGFVQDLEHALVERAEFTVVDVNPTEDAAFLVEAVATVAPTVGSVDVVLAAVDATFLEFACGRSLRASKIGWYREGVVLRFVTCFDDRSVAGTILASGPQWFRLVRKRQPLIAYEGRLPELPIGG